MINYTYEELDNKEFRSKIAKRLHDERKQAGLSLDALAEKMTRSKPTVQSWERGWENGTGENRIPDMNQLIDLCAIYNCTPEYLLCEYDEKTKQHTDIGAETGLLPQNITKLQRIMSSIQSDSDYESKINYFFLAFLNHIISNTDRFNDLLIERINMAAKQLNFDNDPDKDTLLKAVDVVNSTAPLSDLFGSHSPFLSGECIQAMQDYFFESGYNTEKVTILMGKFHDYYWDVLSPYHTKQSDFMMSDTFLDISKEFFRIYPQLSSDNNKFKKYLDALFSSKPELHESSSH